METSLVRSDAADGLPSLPEQHATVTRCGVPLIHYNGHWFIKPTIRLIESVHGFGVRPDDILVASFPKSGTTWTQETVWQILRQAGVPLAHSDSSLEHRFPMLEFDNPRLRSPTLDEISKRESPRLLKTHLPFEYIPKGFAQGRGKVIYVARNPKDVCVSFDQFYRIVETIQFKGTHEEYIDAFLTGEVLFGPWIDHVTSFWERRNDANVLLITYENLQQDGLNTVRKMAEFLEVSLTEDQLVSVLQDCSFQSMEQKPQTNYTSLVEQGYLCQGSKFMRKGIVGDWVNYFTPEKAAAFDELMNKRLQELGLKFQC